MNRKRLSLLGLARRAGKLEMGYDAAVIAAKEGKARLLVAACNLSEKTCKNLEFEGKRSNVPVLRLSETLEEVSKACGKKAGIAAICDEGFAHAVEEAGKKEEI